MLDSLLFIAAFIATIGVLVTFHEWGHFYAARKLGVKVLRFSVGFGKPIWKYQAKDGVEYVVAAIPLGGYVKMLDHKEVEVDEQELEYSFSNKALWKRSVILLAGPLANFVLAIFLFMFMFMNGVVETRAVLGPVAQDGIAGPLPLK